MKNLLDEVPLPYESLTGRLKYSCDFVKGSDLVGKRVLNIGCGFGWFELFCLSKNSLEVNSIEIDEESIATARKHLNNPKVKFSVASALSLPFAANTFDTIVSWEVLEHIPRHTEEQMFAEIFRVLKPNGQFYMSHLIAPFGAQFSTLPGGLSGTGIIQKVASEISPLALA